MAWGEAAVALPVGGFYKARRTGEAHAFEARLIHTLQHACDTGSYDSYKRYAEGMRKAVRETHGRGNKIMFIGNGGSAGIASHLAIDYAKNGGLRATAFNDAAALTWSDAIRPRSSSITRSQTRPVPSRSWEMTMMVSPWS